MKPTDLAKIQVMMKCQKCGGQLKKVSWKITAGAFDAGKEVEQTVFQCPDDKEFISLEISTGNESEFAFTFDDESYDQEDTD